MATQKKIETVKNLSEKVSRARAIFLADYRGLKHRQLEELRKLLKKVNSEITITKNRLLKRAIGDQAASLEKDLNDATATLFAYADPVAPLKELLKFFKTSGVGKTKAGLFGQTRLTTDEVIRLAQLPSREILLTKLVSELNTPIQNLHRALSWNINKLVWALSAIKKINSN